MKTKLNNPYRLIKIFIIVICFLHSLPSLCQDLLAGKVLDGANQSALSGATILINDSLVFTTDNFGNFSIPAPEWPVKLEVRYIGYESVTTLIADNSRSSLIIEINASNYMLGEVMVSAFDISQTLRETPGSISLINKPDLMRDNDVTIVPALNRVPGIYSHSGTYNTNRITIRGIGSRSLFGTNKIRAYFGNISLTSGDGETSVEDIDPGLIERIEILKGPSSSLYGAGLGGTMLIKPLIPVNGENRITYQFTTGSFGFLRNSISAVTGTEKFNLTAGVNRVYSDGYRDNNRYTRNTAGIAGKWKANQKMMLNWLINYVDMNAGIPSSIDRDTYDQDPEAAAPTWKATEGFEDYQKLMTGIGFQHVIGKNNLVDASVFFNIREAYERRPFNILNENAVAAGTRIKFLYDQEILGNPFEFSAGMELFMDLYTWQTIENINKQEGNLISDNKEDRYNNNFFIKTDYSINNKTFFTAGINLNFTNYKYEDIYSTDGTDQSGMYDFGTTVSPRIGISQAIADKLNLYGSISHGFSPPTLPETLTPEGIINPDIRPETGINYEIGIRGFGLKKRLYADLALYTLQVKNLLVAQRTGDDEFVGVNAGKTSHTGLELVLNYDILQNSAGGRPGLAGMITYALSDFIFKEFVNDSTDYSGNQLTGIPAHVFNAGLDLNFPFGVYAIANYQFVDEIPMNDGNSEYSDPYHLLNLKAGFRKTFFSHLNIEIYGIINNVLNEKYASMIMVNATGQGGRPPRYYYPGMPVNFYPGFILGYEF